MSNDKEREAAYDQIDRFLRNNLGSDEDYAEYSKALDLVLGASLAASAGSEPVATVFTMEALTPGGGVKYHASIHKALPAGTKLYAHPSSPEGMVGGWRPIAEAPKDGRFLVRDGVWHGEVANNTKLSDVAMVERKDNGAFEVADTDYYSAYIVDPTGWMPAPPIAAGGGKEAG